MARTDIDFADRILVDTGEIIAWNKPAGLLTTGRNLDDPDCAQHLAIEYIDHNMIWALHQLDRDTSGVVLFARQKHLVKKWQDRWNTPAIEKYYALLVHGHLPESPTTIDAPLTKLGRTGYTEVAVDDDGKRAVTDCWELDRSDHYSLVVARLRTGRTHQIRAHLQHIGCPLIGEERYNSIPCGYHDRHALHALAIRTDRSPPLDLMEAPVAEDLVYPAEKLDLDLDRLRDWTEQLDLR